MKFAKKQIVIDAFQWFKHGDVHYVEQMPGHLTAIHGENYRVGWLPTPEGGHMVYPGDWIIVDKKKRLSSCNPVTFARLYEVHESERILPMPGGFGKSA